MSASVVFIIGLSANEKQYADLIAYIQKFYAARLPPQTPLHVTRWDKNVAGEITKKFPKGDLVIVGFSFGGQKAVEICETLKRPIKQLVLLDPVDYHNGNKPNLAGFVLPGNVAKAHCFFRGATAVPWSGYIARGLTTWTNVRYVANTADPHGEYVWKSDTMNIIKGAL